MTRSAVAGLALIGFLRLGVAGLYALSDDLPHTRYPMDRTNSADRVFTVSICGGVGVGMIGLAMHQWRELRRDERRSRR